MESPLQKVAFFVEDNFVLHEELVFACRVQGFRSVVEEFLIINIFV